MNLTELLDRIERNAESIFVRAEVNGVTGNYALTELPVPLALHHAFRMIRKRSDQQEAAAETVREWGDDAIPKIRLSAFVMGIMEPETNALQCLQIGAALLLEKPLLLIRRKGTWIPPKLLELADSVVDIDSPDDATARETARERVQAAMDKLAKRLEAKQ